MKPAALITCTLLLSNACGAAAVSNVEVRDVRARLRAALAEPVATREQRDAHSRLLVDAAERGALEGLDQSEIRAALGRGAACRAVVCQQQGFGPDDYYYEIGVIAGEDVKQLPVLIVGFDPRGGAARLWTLTTH